MSALSRTPKPVLSILTTLVADLDRAGVKELIPDGDALRYRPRDALTPDLAERLRTHKEALLLALRPPVAAVEPVEAVLLKECIDPPNPCSKCGGMVFWWNIPGNQRCMACDPPVTAIRALERVEKIRRRHGIPSPAGVPEMLADLKRIIPKNP